MKKCLAILFLLHNSVLFAQLGFCEGSKGDPIFHEDFGTGNTSGPPLPVTTTNYTFVYGDPNDGEYTISNQIGAEIGGWHSYLPQTTVSNGRALIVNADFTSGQFYKTSIIGLCENTSYEFSAYLINIYNRSNTNCSNGGIPINIKFEIWDETDTLLLKEGSTGDIESTTSPVWKQYALTFQSQAGQDAVILKMFNNGEGGCGNDLAIDDIIFRSCGDFTQIDVPNGADDLYVICEQDLPLDVTLYAIPDFTVYSQHAYQWQESNDNINWIDLPGENSNSVTPSPIAASTYYRVKVAEDAVNLNNNLCSSASEPYFIQVVETPLAPVSYGDVLVCGNNNIPLLTVEVENDEIVNWYDAEQNGNLLAEASYTYQPEGEGVYYAQAFKLNATCPGGPRTPIKVSVDNLPLVYDEFLSICEAGVLQLDAGVEDVLYEWSTGNNSREISITAPGTYSVLLTTLNGCSLVKNFEISRVEIPVIDEIISVENTITIQTETPGEFEYSLDGINFQLSNTFNGVPGGVYNAYVRDLLGCETTFLEFPHIVIPRFITPNNDGYNDTFRVRGTSYFNSSHISLFDRYGKLIKSGNLENFEWDGTLNGSPLPAGDYWYEISIENFENIKGSVSLIR